MANRRVAVHGTNSARLSKRPLVDRKENVLDLKVSVGGEYLHFGCGQCDGPVEVAFLGPDPTMQILELECKKCEIKKQVKVKPSNPGAWADRKM